MNSERVFFRSYDLSLPRQSAKNPASYTCRHGAVDGFGGELDAGTRGGVVLPRGINKPEGDKMSRGKDFIYKRMKENL